MLAVSLSLRIAGLVGLALLAGCAATSSAQNGGAAASGSTLAVASLPYGDTAQEAGVDYRIGPLDVLEVTVFQVSDLSKTVQVSASGQISLPLVGAVDVGGKTVGEVETDIAAKLGAKYLQSPQVSVFVKEYVSQRITVEGAVGKPGIYPTTGRTTLLQAIALAQGLTEIADANGIVVFRTVDGERQAAKFDFAAIRAGKASDPVVLGGDIIVVDQSGVKTTLRNIRQAIPVFGLFSPLI